MCGRLSLSSADHRIAAELLADAVPGFEPEGLARWLERAGYEPRPNVGPGQRHWLVRGRGGRAILDRGTWGLPLAPRPGEAGSAKLVINARAETVGSRPLFRDAFAGGRCLIPADGFFEWERRDGQRLPHWFHRPDRSALLFAGVLRPDAEGPRFSVITVAAADELRWIHDRMPAIVERGEVLDWLGAPPDRARAILKPRALGLEATRVSARFNTSSYEGPLVAATEADDPGQRNFKL